MSKMAQIDKVDKIDKNDKNDDICQFFRFWSFYFTLSSVLILFRKYSLLFSRVILRNHRSEYRKETDDLRCQKRIKIDQFYKNDKNAQNDEICRFWCFWYFTLRKNGHSGRGRWASTPKTPGPLDHVLEVLGVLVFRVPAGPAGPRPAVIRVADWKHAIFPHLSGVFLNVSDHAELVLDTFEKRNFQFCQFCRFWSFYFNLSSVLIFFWEIFIFVPWGHFT